MIRAVEESTENSEANFINNLQIHEVQRKGIFAKMLLRDRPVTFQLDCGASVNIIPRVHIEDVVLEPTTRKLRMWNESVVSPLGVACVDVINPRTNKNHRLKFYVVQE